MAMTLLLCRGSRLCSIRRLCWVGETRAHALGVAGASGAHVAKRWLSTSKDGKLTSTQQNLKDEGVAGGLPEGQCEHEALGDSRVSRALSGHRIFPEGAQRADCSSVLPPSGSAEACTSPGDHTLPQKAELRSPGVTVTGPSTSLPQCERLEDSELLAVEPLPSGRLPRSSSPREERGASRPQRTMSVTIRSSSFRRTTPRQTYRGAALLASGMGGPKLPHERGVLRGTTGGGDRGTARPSEPESSASSTRGVGGVPRELAGTEAAIGENAPFQEPVKRIILLRNGKNAADDDIGEYLRTPDWRIQINEIGVEENRRAGRELGALLGNEPVYFYFSPYWRSRQSLKYVLEGFDSVVSPGVPNVIGVREDVRLRAGDIGRYKTKEELLKNLSDREEYGTFFYRFPHGESGADVCDRVTSFLDAFQRERVLFPMDTNVVILTHGLTIRMFIKRWFHLTVDTFHTMVSPPTGSLSTLTRLHHRSHYRLDDVCISGMNLPLSLNEDNGYKYRNKQLLGSMSTGAPYM